MFVRKRLDIYFIKDLMFRRAHQQLSESLRLTLDEDDYISGKTRNKLRKNYEDNYNEWIRSAKREYKRIIRERKAKIKAGEVDQKEEIASFLQSIGVEFIELPQEEPEIQAETVEIDTPEGSAEKPEIDAETDEKAKDDKEYNEQDPGQEQDAREE